MTKDSVGSFLLVYASQTGQAKAIAEEIAERAEQHGLEARLHCISMTEKKFWLEREPLAVLISSTTGDGEPPETAAKFFRRLHKKTLPKTHMQHLHYAFLGLGDSNYSNFCNCGKNLDKRLDNLGAKRFYEAGFADDATGLEIVVEPWIDGLFPALRKHLGIDTEISQAATNIIGTCNGVTERLQSSGNIEHDNDASINKVTSTTPPINRTNDQNVEDDTKERTNVPSDQSSNCDTKCDSSIFDSVDNSIKECDTKEEKCFDKLVSDTSTLSGQGDVIVNIASKQSVVNCSGDATGIDVIDNSTNQNPTVNLKNGVQEGKTDQKGSIQDQISDSNNPSISNKPSSDDKTKENIKKSDDLRIGDTGSLTKSVEPLTSSNLSLPLCPAPYIQLQYHPEETLDLSSVPLQNGCDFPSSASTVSEVPVISATTMTRQDAVKTTLKLQLDIMGCGWSYQPGDAVGIVCPNNNDEVQLLIDRLSINDQSDVGCSLSVLGDTKKKNAKVPVHYPPGKASIRYIFTNCCDIRDVPKKALIRSFVERTSDPSEKRRLQELCSKQGSSDYTDYIRAPGVSVLDLLLAFPSCKPPVTDLLEHCPRLLPRPYSASSCDLTTPGKFEFVFNIVEISPGEGRAVHRRGLCTGWLDNKTKGLQGKSEENCDETGDKVVQGLEDLSIAESFKIPVFLRKCQYFHPPENLSVPYIMIGPGTGVAPFVGFLRHRQALLSCDDPPSDPGEVWLFYGCRHQHRDFLFRKELEDFESRGILTKLLVSFSRDQTENLPDDVTSADKMSGKTEVASARSIKYVQDNMNEYGSELTDLICDKDAQVYVCGDAKGMARGVNQALLHILQQHRGLSEKEAMDFVMKMRINKKYLEDVWT